MANLKKELIAGIDRARAAGRGVTVGPPMSREAIADLEVRSGEMPREVRDLVEYAAGFSIDGLAVRFAGDEAFEFESAFPRGLPIAADGVGNFWVVDVGADGSWGAVFFVAHDPPVILIQARDLIAFIEQVSAGANAAELAEPYVTAIWKRNPHVIPHEQAVASTDDVLQEFAQQLGPDFVIADLRDAAHGKGFVWGLAGPNTEVRRAGNQLLFATERKKRGVLGRLFSR